MKEKIILAWSGGKDSAFALHELKKSDEYEVAALLTTLTADYDRTSMHGIRRTLLEKQVESVDLPLEKVLISKKSSNEEYESKMREVLEKCKKNGISSAAFGDIFLEDVRKYRIGNMSKVGMEAIFPLWKKDTKTLSRAFIDAGFKAITTCVDSKHIDKRFVGRAYDNAFLSELPSDIDPCGENGEFHSFVFNGPMFRKPIAFTKGETVLRDNRYWYTDLIP